MLKSGDFTGKLNKTAALYPDKKLPLKRIVLVGLGKETDFTCDRLRAQLLRLPAPCVTLASQACCCPLTLPLRNSVHTTQRVLSWKALFSGCTSSKNIKQKTMAMEASPSRPARCWQALPPGLTSAKKGAAHAEAVSRAVCLARDLVSRPSNTATPEHLARTAKTIAALHGIACTVLDGRQAEKLRHGRFLLSGPRQRRACALYRP